MNFKGYFATRSGHLYFTDGKILQLKSGDPHCCLSDFKPREIKPDYICRVGVPGYFSIDDEKLICTSNIVARFEV